MMDVAYYEINIALLFWCCWYHYVIHSISDHDIEHWYKLSKRSCELSITFLNDINCSTFAALTNLAIRVVRQLYQHNSYENNNMALSET